MATVLVLEDDPVTLNNLVNKVTSNDTFEVIATCQSLSEARRALQNMDPDVLLVDLELPDGDATDLIREYTDKHPNVPSLVISVFGDEQRVVGAIRAGARGYLLKDDSQTRIGSAISSVLAGESPISPAIASHLIRHFQVDSLESDESLLSEREYDVLNLAAKGYSYKESAAVLGVKVSTVGTYTMRIYTKLAVNSRAEALFEARKLGLMKD